MKLETIREAEKSEPVWKCEEKSSMPIEEYEKRLYEAKYRAKRAESENAMLKECIVRMAMGRYGVLND